MDLIYNLTDKYLVCDARHPIITGHSLAEELLLYNLDEAAKSHLLAEYHRITGKQLSDSSHPEQLSGGQKVILMALLALFCPASDIAFIDLYHNLDPQAGSMLADLMDSSSKEIIQVSSDAL